MLGERQFRIDRARERGREAFLEGKSDKDFPKKYTLGCDCWWAWMEGFEEEEKKLIENPQE